MSSKRPFFPLFFKDKDKLKYLSMEQRGELLTALFGYAADGNIPELDGLVGFAFEVFREGIDTSLEKYEETCRKRQEAAKKGAAARWGKKDDMPNGIPVMPNASGRMPNDSKNAETEDRSRREKKEVEDEVEAETEGEERSQSAHTDTGSDTDAEIRNYFIEKVGREPSKEFIRSAKQTALSVRYICAAIDKSVGARVPEGYATNILRRWAADGVPSNVRPVVISDDAPLEPWEEEWLAEYRAMTKEQEGDEYDIGGYSETATVAN
ncbi:DUF6291 domain-containing protein [Butyricicoccus sp.]|uniref:DUF6291 domain-containing protein n=1 Tax=Butyricicoccus sp. TaxID=2049021 RepID=UPI003D7EE0B0